MSQSKCGEREAKQDEVVEIDPSWVNDVLDNIEMSRQRKHPTKPSIFKVPAILRSGDPDAYEPKLVSIGPYHHGNKNLQAMEEIKWRILDNVLPKARKNSIQRYLKKMQDLEAEARRYYSETINMESHRFAEMLLLDSCFIIYVFIPNGAPMDVWDDIGFPALYVLADFLLLENQLPYFIINDVLSVLDIPGLESFHIQTGFCNAVEEALMPFQRSRKRVEDFQVAHLLHLLHKRITRPSGADSGQATSVGTSRPESGPQSPSPQQSRSRSRSRWPLNLRCLKRSRSRRSPNRLAFMGPVPSATDLVEAGVKIKVSKADYNLLDILFNKKKGLLEIPAIHVYASTNLILRNLIALEQCYMVFGMKITYYSIFVDCIINTKRDVALLSREGIIVRGSGNDTDIALLFNQLCKGVVIDGDNYLDQVFKEVNDYCNSRRNRWRSRLMRWRSGLMNNYFSNPWTIISVIAAAVLLVLTIVQTLFSVLSYTQQINSSHGPHP